MAVESQIRLAAKLYEMRDTAKRFLGDRYAGHMADLRKMIEQVQSVLHIEEPLAAATKLCTANSLDGVAVIYVMAAAVEMIEPTQDPATAEQPK